MKLNYLKLFFVISLVLNAACISLFISALGAKTKALSYYNAEKEIEDVVTTACVVSVQKGRCEVTFGTLEIEMKTGGIWTLQYSLLMEGSQLNLSRDPLYDRELLSIERTGYGLIIHALKPGRCELQTLGENGITDIAVINITG